ncbi:hypothetical protein HDV02_003192 [Globomyces sp. JEL0801]|nr:hypothetical protein HDV02_003192 [Globomyces sp. JEL0801]
MLFRQLFDLESSTYTYLLADENTHEGILIDPVLEQVDRDLRICRELETFTKCSVNHFISDSSNRSIIAKASTAKADIYLEHGNVVNVGSIGLKAIATPGHTAGCMSFYLEQQKLVFTGDAVLIRGCGRTDFQGGDAGALYDNIHQHIFTLPNDTIIYPAHDYKGILCSSVGEEKSFNPRLTKTKEEFVQFMKNLGLPYPKKIDASLPANLKCGIDY